MMSTGLTFEPYDFSKPATICLASEYDGSSSGSSSLSSSGRRTYIGCKRDNQTEVDGNQKFSAYSCWQVQNDASSSSSSSLQSIVKFRNVKTHKYLQIINSESSLLSIDCQGNGDVSCCFKAHHRLRIESVAFPDHFLCISNDKQEAKLGSVKNDMSVFRTPWEENSDTFNIQHIYGDPMVWVGCNPYNTTSYSRVQVFPDTIISDTKKTTTTTTTRSNNEGDKMRNNFAATRSYHQSTDSTASFLFPFI